MVFSDDLIARDLAATDAELGIFQPTEYHVYIRDSSYRRVAELEHWTDLSLRLAFNDVGTWTLETANDNREANLLTKTGGIIVTRVLNGVERTIFSGFVWTEWGWTENAFRAAGYSDDALLWQPARPTPGLPSPPWPDDYYVRTGVASTVMRNLVNENLGPSAVVPWQNLNITFPSDPLLGSSITVRGNLQPIITLLAELAITPYAGGLGFYLRQSDTVANKLEFVVYAPEDKSEDAKFSIDLGTASQYEEIQTAPDANHVYVLGGDGFGTNRTVVEALDTDSITEWGRRISTVIDRRGTTDTSELEQNAAEAIAGVSTLKRTAITPFDVKSLQFGEDYDLGTLVTIVTHGGETVDLIRQVDISLDPEQGPSITPIVGQGDGSDEERMATITRTIQNRISNLERNWNVPPDSIDNSMLRVDSVDPDNLRTVNDPVDRDIYTYDSSTQQGEWLSFDELVATLNITTTGVVQASRFTSTVTTGTAPLTVSSTTRVTNLNADLLDGLSSADFATDEDLDNVIDMLDDYVQVSGDTMTGMLTIEIGGAGNDQAIKLKHNASVGGIYLGADNSIAPDFVIKNNAGTQIALITNAGLFMAGSQTSEVGLAGNNDVQCDELWLTDGNNVRRIETNGNTLQISSNATGGGTPGATHMTIDSAGTVSILALQVDNNANVSGDLDVDNDAVVRGGLDVLVDFTVGGTVNISGATTISDTIRVTQVARFDQGSTGGFSASSWDGYLLMSHNGTQVEVPYLTH